MSDEKEPDPPDPTEVAMFLCAIPREELDQIVEEVRAGKVGADIWTPMSGSQALAAALWDY